MSKYVFAVVSLVVLIALGGCSDEPAEECRRVVVESSAADPPSYILICNTGSDVTIEIGDGDGENLPDGGLGGSPAVTKPPVDCATVEENTPCEIGKSCVGGECVASPCIPGQQCVGFGPEDEPKAGVCASNGSCCTACLQANGACKPYAVPTCGDNGSACAICDVTQTCVNGMCQ